MSLKVKKPHIIKVAGVSCVNGTYKLNVSGRSDPLQLFQVATMGETLFRFVHLPKVMSKRDAVEYLLVHVNHAGMIAFLKDKLAKYDFVPVPKKRGRPPGKKNKPAIIINPKGKIVSGLVGKKEIKATIGPVEKPMPVLPIVTDAEKKKRMDETRANLMRNVQAKMVKKG